LHPPFNPSFFACLPSFFFPTPQTRFFFVFFTYPHLCLGFSCPWCLRVVYGCLQSQSLLPVVPSGAHFSLFFVCFLDDVFIFVFPFLLHNWVFQKNLTGLEFSPLSCHFYPSKAHSPPGPPWLFHVPPTGAPFLVFLFVGPKDFSSCTRLVLFFPE